MPKGVKGFKQGESGNPNGRAAGTPNKVTRDIKEAYKQLIENNLENLTKWLEAVAKENPEKAIRILSELSEYVVPKLARTDITTGDKPLRPRIDVTVDDSKTAEMLKRMKDELSQAE